MVSIIRYPGSKAKLYRVMQGVFPDEAVLGLWSSNMTMYCEPFVGSGAICWRVLSTLLSRPKVLINDIDPYIYRLWQVIRDDAASLRKMVRENTPRMEDFEAYKATDGEDGHDPVMCAYRKLVLHNTSWSGLGAMAGSVLGGRRQRSAYNHLCRWNPVRIESGIRQIAAIMRRHKDFHVTCYDFEECLSRMRPDGIAYLDPPYYKQGEALYKHNMADTDHERLARVLRSARYRFVLSYDDHARIRDLYSWAKVSSFEMTPTIQESVRKPRRKNSELLITNF